ncbi:hypothetical protein CHELA40_12219 [Chelatococcus asaccharovorans]|nr:hypothetical protein CHELA40_12219 [Chelatococcus asaccharovorans]CAH1683215.1 hypothetical protein CHELA17_63388 [Chelatococcus asaccharovorans]
MARLDDIDGARDRLNTRGPRREETKGGWLERAKGIEPSYAAWEAAVLPLNYARLKRA